MPALGLSVKKGSEASSQSNIRTPGAASAQGTEDAVVTSSLLSATLVQRVLGVSGSLSV